MSAPLCGLRVVEFAGLAPAPFCGRILADWGASVIRVDKPHGPDIDRLAAGKRSIVVDSKQPAGIQVLHTLCNRSDVLIDPYRPGVLERLGLGPAVLRASNPGLVYTRITGFGQTGPWSGVAGHDINYLAMSGVLSMLGRKEGPPTPPINLLADFAGGGLTAALGITLALLHRGKTGKGQVVDCSMTEGAAYVASWLYNTRGHFPWGKDRGQNWLDSGMHFYDTYETADGRHMAVGALEPRFYAQLLKGLDLDPDKVGQFDDPTAMKEILRERFKSKTFSHWCEVFDGTDSCVSPVLNMDETPQHPQHKARKAFTAVADTQSAEASVESPLHPDGPKSASCGVAAAFTPSPAPLLSESPGYRDPAWTQPSMGQHTMEVLKELGYTQEETNKLQQDEVVIQAEVPPLKANL